MREIKRAKRPFKDDSRIESAIRTIAPQWAEKRMMSRIKMDMVAGYTGARRDRRQIAGWEKSTADINTIVHDSLEETRNNCGDLDRNNGLAAGAVESTTTAVVGAGGLKPNSQIDNTVLKLSDEELNELQATVEREWKIFAETKDFDLSRISNWGAYNEMTISQSLIRGDIFFNIAKLSTPRINRPYRTVLQAIEGDRVSNENDGTDTQTLTAGIEKNSDGSPKQYHISKFHPGNFLFSVTREWDKIPAFSNQTGRPKIIHYFHQKRPGQSRGFPLFAPVIEEFKMLGTYINWELFGAEIATAFTVFIKSESGQTVKAMDGIGASASDTDYKIDGGAIVDLKKDEDIVIANPGRPNAAFGDFLDHIIMVLGACSGIPSDVFKQAFNSSFSASRAALMQAWAAYLNRRTRLIDNFCNILWAEFFAEGVALGRIPAPGFFRPGRPEIAMAYMGVEWVGPAQPHIKETEAVKAASERINAGLSTHTRETRLLTGGDFDKNVDKLKNEKARLRDTGTTEEPLSTVEHTPQDRREDDESN